MAVIELHNVDAALVDKLTDILNLMENVQVEPAPSRPPLLEPGDPSVDVAGLAGIWEDSDVTLESIRQKAWPSPWKP